MLLYLIHYNQPTKTLYPVSAVNGPLKQELEELIAKQTSEKKRIKAFKEIIDKHRPRSVYQLFCLAIETNNLDLMKKYQLIFTKIIDELRRI